MLIYLVYKTASDAAEHMLIYRYVPWRHRSLIFGIKFIIIFGVAPLPLASLAFIRAKRNNLDILFGGLAAGTVVVAFLLVFLPEDKPPTHMTTPVEQLPLVTLKYVYPIHAERLHLEEM